MATTKSSVTFRRSADAAGSHGPLLLTGAAAALGAGACCLVMLPAYVQTSVAAAAWWALAGLGLAVLSVLSLLSPSRRVLAAGAAWSGVLVAVWLVCRVGGLGPREILWGSVDTVVGFTDVVHAAVQGLAAVLLGIAAARWPRRRVRSPLMVSLTAAVPLLVVGALTTAGLAFPTDGFSRVTTTAPATYCAPHGVRLGMDVYEPRRSARRPASVVLYVHGGGLILGDRRRHGLGAALADHDGALFPGLLRSLTAQGMVVASIDYRLAPLAPWPAQLQDVKCAVRYVRAHATALGIDPGRVGVWGSSGGGQLAALLGIAPGFDVGPYREQSSRVQAVVDMFGPSDLNAMRDASAFARSVVRIGLGASRRVRAAASPLTYVAPGDPPFLILHGTRDTLVPPAQSARLAQRLAAAHVPVNLISVRGAGHGLDGHDQQPSPDGLVRTVTAFFVRTLGAA